ncbi:hypothetical protein D8674_004656 [Pyrus ussuriensis x Pyrus communis]|uniref:Uncharacterized protein n=1 Tax=Pyrus ussuriensis x Pyrus communis TaxID=2448454 RepID=A0A5N5FPS2_9ROSA|nr:hypothetical protein D8674_004656 [Pyrus ussuriensis x Pyrus communis]
MSGDMMRLLSPLDFRLMSAVVVLTAEDFRIEHAVTLGWRTAWLQWPLVLLKWWCPAASHRAIVKVQARRQSSGSSLP